MPIARPDDLLLLGLIILVLLLLALLLALPVFQTVIFFP
jgi:hypothetical protein